MLVILEETVQQLEVNLHKYYDIKLNKGYSETDIEEFKQWVNKKLGAKVPLQEYIDSLQLVNGVNYDGLYFYGVSPSNTNLDIIFNNSAWYDAEEHQNYLFYAHDDLSWYLWNNDSREYQIIDKPGGEIIEIFESFNEMMEEALKTALY